MNWKSTKQLNRELVYGAELILTNPIIKTHLK